MIFLREMRLNKRLTQQELAQASGVGQGVISDIESGATQNPRLDTLIKLANALDCAITDLLDAGKNKAV